MPGKPSVEAGRDGSGGAAGSGGTVGGAGGLSGSGGACAGTSFDTDGDGVPGCMDRCPQDLTKIVTGVCGCNLSDTAAPTCLAHRYSFGGTGTVVVDSISPVGNGTANGTTLTGSGLATLAGGVTDQYINLPRGLVSSFDNVTYEVWATWRTAAQILASDAAGPDTLPAP